MAERTPSPRPSLGWGGALIVGATVNQKYVPWQYNLIIMCFLFTHLDFH